MVLNNVYVSIDLHRVDAFGDNLQRLRIHFSQRSWNIGQFLDRGLRRNRYLLRVYSHRYFRLRLMARSYTVHLWGRCVSRLLGVIRHVSSLPSYRKYAGRGRCRVI